MKKLILISLLALSSEVASAQFYDKMFFASWSVNQPLTNRDFIGRSSTRGVRLGYREMMNDHFAFGFDLSWSTYDDYTPRQTYYRPNSTLTTDFTNYSNNYGALLTGDYYFFTERRVMPYAGLGAGVGYNSYKVYYNVYNDGKNAFGLLLRPQAGVWVKVDDRKNWAFNVGVHFDFSTAKGTDFGYKNFMNAGLELGLVFLDW